MSAQRRYRIKVSKVLSIEEKNRLEGLLDINLGDGQPVFEPEHDPQARCFREGCAHAYERHFDTDYIGDGDPVYVTSCKYCNCTEFIESGISSNPVSDIDEAIKLSLESYILSNS